MTKTDDELREQILALKRPSFVEARYIIEAELDDLLALIKSREQAARIDELEELIPEGNICIYRSELGDRIAALKANTSSNKEK